MVSLQEEAGKLYLHVYDSLGRHVGITSRDEVEIGIPGATYTDWGLCIAITLPADVEEFRIVVDATYAEFETESYWLTITSTDGISLLGEMVSNHVIEQGFQQETMVETGEGTFHVDHYPLIHSVESPISILQGELLVVRVNASDDWGIEEARLCLQDSQGTWHNTSTAALESGLYTFSVPSVAFAAGPLILQVCVVDSGGFSVWSAPQEVEIGVAVSPLGALLLPAVIIVACVIIGVLVFFRYKRRRQNTNIAMEKSRH
jgi:hypothetical protein